MHGNRWLQKPPAGYKIDTDHHLSQGVVFFAPLNENSGPSARDLVTGLRLKQVGAPQWSSGLNSGILASANQYGFSATAPLSLQLQPPFTMAVGFRPIAPSTGNTPMLAGFENATGTVRNGFYWNTAPTLALAYNANGTGHAIYGSANCVVGNDYVAVATFSGAGNIGFWLNGKSIGSATGITLPISYGTNPTLSIGESLYAYNSGSLFYWFGLWNYAFPYGHINDITRNPYQLFEPKRVLSVPIYGAVSHPVYSLTGPTTGLVHSASTNFTLSMNLFDRSDTLTLSDGVKGGMFTPSSLTISSFSRSGL